MARSRREKTLADYVVIALSPALIMTLVGSLAFFLLEVAYRGQYRERLMWVLFCYVFGAVLVARIAIEEGKERANLFGLTLAAATAFFAFRFVDTVFVAWTLLAVIWFCAWKLVFDCTLIDDDEDASGEGLLQAAGFDPGERRDVSPPVGSASQPPPHSKPDPLRNPTTDPGLEGPPDEAKRRPHSPGLWVVYFSLAALPLFGIGQLFIPAAEAGRRSYAFQLLAVYVASALGLLLSTSFLGLRRYLRQRKLQMPAAMTGSWLGMGAGMALVLLLLALFIPRPQGEYTLTQLVDKIDEKARAASKVAMLGGDKGEGEGRRIGQQDEKSDQPGEGGKPPDEQKDGKNPDAQKEGEQNGRTGESSGKEGQQSGQGKSDGEKKSEGSGQGKDQGDGKKQGQQQAQSGAKDNPAGEKADGDKQKDQRADGKQAGAEPKDQGAKGAAQAPRNPATSPPSSFLGQLAGSIKWLIYGILALVGIYFLVRHWSRIVAILAQMWAELLNLWHSLFGGKPDEGAGGDDAGEVVAAARLRPFASYENPFFSGADRRMTPAQLALYTFDALEAWAREELVPRPPEQTPLEFAEALSQLLPELSKDVTQTAQLYARVVYAKKSPSRESVDVLERLWRRMGTRS